MEPNQKLLDALQNVLDICKEENILYVPSCILAIKGSLYGGDIAIFTGGCMEIIKFIQEDKERIKSN